MKKEAHITAKNLAIGYAPHTRREKRLHTGLSFALYSGELTCLLGPNGAGKSTLLRTIGAIQPTLEGKLTLQEREINAWSERQLSRRIGLVLTDQTMAGGLTVYELVGLGRHPHTGFFGRLKPEDRRQVEKAIEAVGMQHRAENYLAELSDGERQKVMIAKALAQECPILLLDEPTAFLDITSRIEIMTLLHRLAQEKQKTILLSTHDLEQALLLADRLWLLSRQNGLQTGNPEDLALSGEINRFFHRDGISFDLQNGTFGPDNLSQREVELNARSEFYFWAKNLLVRNGYRITDRKKENTVSVTVSSPTSISLCFPGKPALSFSSFEAWADYLKDHS